MIIPVRCFSCGVVVAHKWEEFNELVASGTEVSDALDKIGFSRYCCRRMYVGHLDLIHEVAPFSQQAGNQTQRARGLAWPILGGWGSSDPGSNPGGPTK